MPTNPKRDPNRKIDYRLSTSGQIHGRSGSTLSPTEWGKREEGFEHLHSFVQTPVGAIDLLQIAQADSPRSCCHHCPAAEGGLRPQPSRRLLSWRSYSALACSTIPSCSSLAILMLCLSYGQLPFNFRDYLPPFRHTIYSWLFSLPFSEEHNSRYERTPSTPSSISHQHQSTQKYSTKL
jgi:hypothetical protein